MTKEDKDLLLKDISARLPYGVKVLKDTDSYKIRGIKDDFAIIKVRAVYGEKEFITQIGTIKPYLRPISSMTEEEFEKLKEYSGLKYEQLDLASYQNGTYKCLDFYLSEVPSYVVILVFDWLNAHHFDYRGLIEKGLALEAPAEMYNLEKK